MLSAVNMPDTKEKFIPNFPTVKPRELNWMGRTVLWIRESENQGIIYRTSVFVLTFIVSVFLVVSIVFSPIFIYGFKEYILQSERERYDRMHSEIVEMAKDFGRQNFLRGRTKIFEEATIQIGTKARKEIVETLELKLNDAKGISDYDLLQRIVLKHDHFLNNRKISIQ